MLEVKKLSQTQVLFALLNFGVFNSPERIQLHTVFSVNFEVAQALKN